MPEASDPFIIFVNTYLGAAKASFNRCGEVFVVLRQKVFEDNAEYGDGGSEDDDVRGEGHDGYWRRHYGGLWCDFFLFWFG